MVTPGFRSQRGKVHGAVWLWVNVLRRSNSARIHVWSAFESTSLPLGRGVSGLQHSSYPDGVSSYPLPLALVAAECSIEAPLQASPRGSNAEPSNQPEAVEDVRLPKNGQAPDFMSGSQGRMSSTLHICSSIGWPSHGRLHRDMSSCYSKNRMRCNPSACPHIQSTLIFFFFAAVLFCS